ncbi:MAG TPA: LLM class flavin-dependent oxidoreductase [Hyphomicrobiales bacterium]|nr:LLM class flavin-dependent oxidoreductase [Hyphomicrobiales bacterium]
MFQSRALRAGVFLPPFHPNEEDPMLCMERDFELMQWLDKLGFAEAWIGEHHSGGNEIYGQPELFIATAAERTRNIKLGTGVISLPYHHPFMVADRIVQLDYQTRGRAMFGFGPGLLTSDAQMLGIDPDTQRDRMADAIDVITRLLAGETVTRQTEWYTMKNARLHLRPYSTPRPHLAVTSSVTPSGGKLAGRYGLGMLCVAAGSVHGYDALDYNWNLAGEEAAARGGRMDPADWRLMAPFHVAETREKAIQNVRAGFAKWEEYSYSVNPEGGAAIGLPSVEGIIENGRGCIGTPDDALAALERFWDKTGGFGCILMLANNWAPWEETKRSYELFARYVLPRFNQRNAWREESMAWLKANNVEFSGKRRHASEKAIEDHFAQDAAKKGRAAE